jgi:hypothetical protein
LVLTRPGIACGGASRPKRFQGVEDQVEPELELERLGVAGLRRGLNAVLKLCPGRFPALSHVHP